MCHINIFQSPIFPTHPPTGPPPPNTHPPPGPQPPHTPPTPWNPTTSYSTPPDPHHPYTPTHPPPGPPPPPGRVLCTVLITIPWAGPPSLIEFHSIDNNKISTSSTCFCLSAVFVYFQAINICGCDVLSAKSTANDTAMVTIMFFNVLL